MCMGNARGNEGATEKQFLDDGGRNGLRCGHPVRLLDHLASLAKGAADRATIRACSAGNNSLQLLVERVDVRVNGVEVRLRPNGLAGLVREVAGSRRRAA